MAFYDQAPGKKKKISYGDLGSWDEEGTHYSGTRKRTGRSGGNPYASSHKGPVKGDDSQRADKRPSMQTEIKRTVFEKKGIRNNGAKPQRKTDQDSNAKRQDTADYRNFEYKNSMDRFNPAETEPDNILIGRNPIREALKSGRDIEKLLVQKGELSGSAKEIISMAKEKRIMIQEVEKSRLDEITQHHQGLIAFASAYAYAEVKDILDTAEERGEKPFIILLDSVTDPHNLGAVIRTAECTGAHGVIIPAHRSVGLTPAAVKASAGAIEHIPVAKVTNLNRTIDELKSKGIWVYAVTMEGEDYESVDFHDGTALVIGSEGEGISHLTMKKCDLSVSLPIMGKLDSLNASVAAGVIMYRVLSCRKKQ